MRQRLTVILTFVVIIGLLVIINTITHVQEEQMHDLELTAYRSTYHSGPTGTRAFHDFLNESGYRVMRWREPLSELLNRSGEMLATLVIVGNTRIPLEDEDHSVLRLWVGRGGRLVIVDRSPNGSFLHMEGWSLTVRERQYPDLDTDPSNVAQMTEKVTELKPVQPTLLTTNVESVMPSRFASRLTIAAVPTPTPTPVPIRAGIGPDSVPQTPRGFPTPTPQEDESEPPPAVAVGSEGAEADEGDEDDHEVSIAPVAHIADREGALLVEYAYGNGSVILLTDPYLITNSGIRLKDNLTLAMNLVGGPQAAGLIAFDEYHQGRGITRNAFASYFAGTPVLAIAGQIVLLVLVVLWTNGRRFGRPLPLPQVDRRSSLEFVASMAELQERSRAFDLAIENIYTRMRRVLARHAGVDYNSSRREIAERIASRSTIDRNELETLMRQCEEAINGEPINSRQSIHLVRRLREIERDLGLRMRSRDVRQAAENI
jgi:hypothetical protein